MREAMLSRCGHVRRDERGIIDTGIAISEVDGELFSRDDLMPGAAKRLKRLYRICLQNNFRNRSLRRKTRQLCGCIDGCRVVKQLHVLVRHARQNFV